MHELVDQKFYECTAWIGRRRIMRRAALHLEQRVDIVACKPFQKCKTLRNEIASKHGSLLACNRRRDNGVREVALRVLGKKQYAACGRSLLAADFDEEALFPKKPGQRVTRHRGAAKLRAILAHDCQHQIVVKVVESRAHHFAIVECDRAAAALGGTCVRIKVLARQFHAKSSIT